MSLPKEPRQLMINLMYLVLTALLALNISNEILNAFKIVNDSIIRSTHNTDANTTNFYENFKKALENPSKREKAVPLNAAALDIKAQSDTMVNYLETLKTLVFTESGGPSDENPLDPKSPDNIDAASDLFIEGKQGGKKSPVNYGEQLKQKILDYRSFVLNRVKGNLTPQEYSNLELSFPLRLDSVASSEENPKGDWARGVFYHVPTVGAMTILSKFQNDVRSTENQVVQTLFKKITDDIVIIQGYDLVASINNGYVLSGQKVTGKINVIPITSSSERRNFSVSTGRTYPDPANPTNTNVVMWEGVASGTGVQTVNVSVDVPSPSGVQKRTAQMQYVVGSKGASLQLDKMNVMYIGVPNPITISAAGVSMQDVSVSISGATLKNTSLGHYDVDVSGLKQGDVASCKIIGKTADGHTEEMGSFPVRVKRIPDPFAKFGGSLGGKMPSNVIQVQRFLLAKLDNFDFEARYQVTDYDFYFIPRKGDAVPLVGQHGEALGAEVQKYLDKVRPGDKIFFDNIKAVGPDKTKRSLNQITVTAI